MPGTKHPDNSGRQLTHLLVLWHHRALIESVLWPPPQKPIASEEPATLKETVGQDNSGQAANSLSEWQ